MSKPREYVGINPGGNSNALISVLILEDFYALMGSSSHPEKIELVEKSALVAAQAEIEEQCRLNGMGAQRELKLMTEVARLKADLDLQTRLQLASKRWNEADALKAELEKAKDLRAILEQSKSDIDFLIELKNELNRLTLLSESYRTALSFLVLSLDYENCDSFCEETNENIKTARAALEGEDL